jgi:hypothetical protein
VTTLYGVGPKKMSEHYAYLAVHPRHVNLGCNYGATWTTAARSRERART